MKASRSLRFQAACCCSIIFRIAVRATSSASCPILETARAAIMPTSKIKSRIALSFAILFCQAYQSQARFCLKPCSREWASFVSQKLNATIYTRALSLHRTWPIALLVLVLVLILVSPCLKRPTFALKPDGTLFNRGRAALERNQFDVAYIDF